MKNKHYWKTESRLYGFGDIEEEIPDRSLGIFEKERRVIMLTDNEIITMKKMVRREVGGCENCGKDVPLVVHHIRRKNAGGLDIPRNLMFICLDCHKKFHENEPNLRRK